MEEIRGKDEKNTVKYFSFIKLPTKIALAEEIEKSENMNIEPNWADGSVIVNIGEIEEIVEGTNGLDCSIFYKSGDSTRINMTIDEMASLLESK